MKIVRELLKGTPIPKVIKVRQKFEGQHIENIGQEIENQLVNKSLLKKIEKGQRVAITVGSRGIANIPLIIKEVVNNIKKVGGKPFIVPTMGSHGGANAKGQVKVLKGLGVTEESIGVPIHSSMEVVKIGEASNGLPVYIDEIANEADAIVVVNRIKPHVAFTGNYESGLMKMISIGLGKQYGASISHDLGFAEMSENIRKIANVVIAKKNIAFGLGIIENAYDETYKIIGMPKEEIEEKEPGLLAEAKRKMAKIYFDKFDVLLVDEMGKNITGSGIDTNVIGRYHTAYGSGGPTITKMVALDLTEQSQGNANGMGIVDFISQRFYDKIKLDQTYPNSLTSTIQQSVKIPMTLENDRLAIAAAIKTCNIFDKSKVRLVRIKNTLKLDIIYISESLLEEAKANPNLEILGNAKEFDFDGEGNLPL
ncbi:MAG: nickel-dependent lactate racemase [Clostridia bacterium]|nr:nickel-dependent lactate racemase [Clostridia bacterium]